VTSAELSAVAASLALGGQNTSGLAGAQAPSHPADSGSTSGTGAVVGLPQPATTSPATAPSAGVKTSHPSAVDDVFAGLPDGPWADPLT
jgi:hypothetical protein